MWNLELIWLVFVGSSALKNQSYNTSNALYVAYFSHHSSDKLLNLDELCEEQYFRTFNNLARKFPVFKSCTELTALM